MTNKVDIKVKQIEYNPYEGFNFEFSQFKISGKDTNIKLINSFRRACSDNIPKYAFPRELIKITKNTTVAYNNDYMSLRLSQLPLFNVKKHNIDPKLSYFHERYWQNVDYSDKERLVADEEKNIEVMIDVQNDSDIIKNIATANEGFKVYIDNEKVDMYNKKYPILIIKLRPNDSFRCSMKGVLGVGERDTIWASCSNTWHYYEDNNPNKDLIVALRSSGMLSIKDISVRACDYLIKKLEIIKKEVIRQFNKANISNEMFEIELKNEDHTLGELINYDFQSHKNIMFAGVSKPDHLIRNMLIKIETKSNITKDTLLKTIKECFKSSTDKVEALKKGFTNIKYNK